MRCRRRFGFAPLHALLLVWLASSSLACATARINEFREFSNKGSAFTDATVVLLDEAAVVAIDANSVLLERTARDLSVEERQDRFLEHNDLLRERVALLRDLQRLSLGDTHDLVLEERRTLDLTAHKAALAAIGGPMAVDVVGKEWLAVRAATQGPRKKKLLERRMAPLKLKMKEMVRVAAAAYAEAAAA